MKAYERLLKYVAINTPCDETSNTTPSSKCQFDLANLLKDEMQLLGVSDIHLTEHCFLYGKLPATKGYENAPALGFIAHIDTVSDYCEHAIQPVITENYNGKDLPLGSSGLILSPDMFEHLKALTGHTLITTDGTTILGADDKAGIAEIMTLIEHLQSQQIPHGSICIAFTPDEEIGTGISLFDIDLFDADFAYTLDGSTEGNLQYENFNAASASFDIHGVSVHPGSAKDTMINACLLAMEINNQLPKHETPRDTAGYEGFYHLVHITGDCGSAHMDYIIRDHDNTEFQNRKNHLLSIAEQLNAKWGAGTVELCITDQYYNMKEIIEQNIHLIENAKSACERVGLIPNVSPIRGGTDGCHLSFRGLPCPDIGTGAHAYHGPYEHISAQSMDKVVDMVIELVKIYSTFSK